MDTSLKPSSPSRVRFGSFELNLNTRELHGENQTVILQDQPYRVLLLLLERGDEIAARDEIRSKLWPGVTRIDFERSINVAVKNLRKALADSPNEPRYIQTIIGLGYRLLMKPEWVY